jgi:hypothetical protein
MALKAAAAAEEEEEAAFKHVVRPTLARAFAQAEGPAIPGPRAEP